VKSNNWLIGAGSAVGCLIGHGWMVYVSWSVNNGWLVLADVLVGWLIGWFVCWLVDAD
jgi:hypothetical protein